MRLSLVFYVFLARTAFGTAVALLPLMMLRATERHVRFQAVLMTVLASGAAALYGAAIQGHAAPLPSPPEAYVSLAGGIPGALLGLAVLGLLINWCFGTFRRPLGRWLLVVASCMGALAVFGTVRLGPEQANPLAILALTTGALLGGMLLAGINDAMVLGHFYLMIRGLPLKALKRAGITVAIVLVLRILHFAGVLLLWDGAAEVLLERELIWTAWRVAFGFIGPLVLLWMVKDTVRLKHTQAATGLLYVAVAFGIMGELAAVYLEMYTGLPT